MASGALGEKGARYVISTLIAIACIGWFGIQSATCGQAFAAMVAPLLGMESTPAFVAGSSIVWGAIMLATACAGFKGLKWLNYIAVPLLVIVCLYGLIAGITTNNGGTAIAAYAPETWSTASPWWWPPLPWAASFPRTTAASPEAGRML